MSCDYLYSLRKVLGWLLAFLMASLPQHLIAQLGDAVVFSSPHADVAGVADPPASAPAAGASTRDEATSGGGNARSGSTQAQARHAR